MKISFFQRDFSSVSHVSVANVCCQGRDKITNRLSVIKELSVARFCKIRRAASLLRLTSKWKTIWIEIADRRDKAT